MTDKGDTWHSFKTGFARAKHRVLAKVGAAETTVDTKIKAESDKLFTLFTLMKRLNKNIEKYQEQLKEISILHNEMAHDILSFDEKDPMIIVYSESMRELEQQRMVMEEYLETYCHDPLRQYLAQFREIRERLNELDLRRLDMDRYFRDYSIKANKGKDATSLAKTEAKHQKTKEGYQTLSDELMQDMPSLFNDRQNVFNPAFASFVNRNSAFYGAVSTSYYRPLQAAASVNEYDAINHGWVITAVELSAISSNQHQPPVQQMQHLNVQQPGALKPAFPNNNRAPSPSNTGRALPVPKPAGGPSGEALYDFTGQDSTELTFKRGDRITLHSTSGDWLDGELHGVKGLVPANYVKIM
ncbi:hypothetical protein SAMD00019534_102680 [Acytostelium subglobosum LB1]|uniref:hypothetical protein n=1 Tax=Acytostelium subglobosum LB1 TaxID=1410327 RepID=UPI000644F3FF|nr:hypothetical protein SAMD00019534_102680 [Acytostelium subglobosum LB1]GAM27093.1 hypothetical protein SAMD00019534_102680 [Acytostelium subglobosum LB1]|eukprot:XP_012749973.1 hypothetical protein SAMD00019534_102680 [Acytostelium subglobosum LB1]